MTLLRHSFGNPPKPLEQTRLDFIVRYVGSWMGKMAYVHTLTAHLDHLILGSHTLQQGKTETAGEILERKCFHFEEKIITSCT
jgi:hypothetical protein